MRKRQRKSRFMTSLVSISFLVVFSFCFGFVIQKNASESLLGFNSNGENLFPWMNLPFFGVQATENDAYPKGDIENNVLFVNLKASGDTQSWLNEDKLALADNVLNAENNSLKAYMKDISNDRVVVNSTLYADAGNDGFLPEQERAFYLNPSADTDIAQLEDDLLRQILIDFNENETLKTKSMDELDRNGDEFIDSMTFVIRGGKDASYSLLWPHQYVFEKTSEMKNYPIVNTRDGELKVKEYNVILSGDRVDGGTETEGILNPTNSDLGVIAHEYLHVFGFPDLYHNYGVDAEGEFIALSDEDRIGDPLGTWDVMDNTNNELPQLPMVYTNHAYSPWGDELADIETLDESKQAVELHKVSYSDSADSIAMILKVDKSINKKAIDEYFMVEYRKKEGWDSSIPSSGLLVYRINTAANRKAEEASINKYCDFSSTGNHCGNMFGKDEVYLFRPNATNPAIGNEDSNTDDNLLNAALSSNLNRTKLGQTLDEVPSFEASTFPSTIYFSDGSNSGIVISNVSNSDGDSISFDVEIPDALEDKIAPELEEASGNGLNGVWINGAPTISVYASDKGHGLASITVSTTDGEILHGSEKVLTYTKTYADEDSVKNTNFEFQATKNGFYKVTAIDQAGNISSVRNIEVTNIDNIAPEIKADKVINTPLNTTMDVEFIDMDSNIKSDTEFYTTLDLTQSIQNIQYDQPVIGNKIILEADFQGKVCITVKDYAGNSAKENSCWIVSNDKTAPTIKLTSALKENEWTADKISININVTDNSNEKQTGISTIEITTEDGHLDASNERQIIKDFGSDGGKEESYDVYVKSNGTYNVEVCDYAGQCKQDSYVVTHIDQSAPVVSNVIVENISSYGLFHTSAHKITMKAHDEPLSANSGLKELRYQLVDKDASYHPDPNADVWVSIPVDEIVETDPDFEGKIYVYALDNVGNSSKIFEQEIKRAPNDVVNNAFIDGVQDKNQKISIIGLADGVQVALKPVDETALKEKIGSDFLASHVLQELYDISLTKEGKPYAMTNEVTIRFHIDEKLQKNGSLQLIKIKEDGSFERLKTTLGEGYIEIKTSDLALYATIVDTLKAEEETSLTAGASKNVETGDETSTLLYAFLIIMGLGVLGTVMKKRYEN